MQCMILLKFCEVGSVVEPFSVSRAATVIVHFSEPGTTVPVENKEVYDAIDEILNLYTECLRIFPHIGAVYNSSL